MINKKYLVIFIIFFLIICFVLLLNYLFKEKKYTENKYIEKFSTNNDSQNSSSDIAKNNLILNGNFTNGKDIQNQINKSGINKIIVMKNPGKSSYVLEQNNSSDLTYYQITTNCEKNSKYILFFWLSLSDNNKNIDTFENLDLEKLIKIKIQNSDYSNFIPKLNYNIIQKMIMTENNSTWFLVKYDFNTGSLINNTMNIYLNYGNNLYFDKYFFTNISLYRVLIDAENFKFNDKLISYVDGFKYETNNTTWHDLSGNGNDLFWSNIPTTNYTDGSIKTLNFKLTGFQSNILSTETFTILFCLNNKNDILNDVTNIYLISIPGNDRYAFEIKISGNNILTLLCDNNQYTTQNLNIFNKSLIAITYNNGLINIFEDGINVLSKTIRKCYFNGSNIIINKNNNMNINLFSILFYNKIIDINELNEIRDYFILNYNKVSNSSPDINNYLMNTGYDYSVVYESLYKGYNKKYNDNNYSSNYDTDFDNQDYKLKSSKENCVNDCKKLCYRFLENGNINKYKSCIKNCKNVLISCGKYCEDKSNKNSAYCKIDKVDLCPKVYKKKGEYIVYVNPNSEYAKKLNYSGERSYGKNLDKAKYLYHLNFPKCPIPNELTIGGGKHFTGSCPYILNELNPCYVSTCDGVNWGVKNYNDLNLNKKCKKTVANYCSINYELDDKCLCWDPKYKDDPKCVEFRKYFENPEDICKPGMFNIEDHPDFTKYIKKDNIPCWGCNVNM